MNSTSQADKYEADLALRDMGLDEVRAASLTIAEHSLGVADCRLLLDIINPQTRYTGPEPAPRRAEPRWGI